MPAVSRPLLPPLQTPKTASFPSEIIGTPGSYMSALIKQESASTPITPPVAYTDFLKALTPVLASPPATGPLQRSMSDESTSTRCSMISNASTSSSLSSNRSDSHKSPSSSVPPTPYARKTPTALKRLRIPHSPAFSPTTCGPSPRTALSGMSSSGMLYSPFSPADYSLDSASRRYFDTPRSACPKSVSVRSVMTRTVTYKRSPPLDPAPKGKKRKIGDMDMPPPSAVKEHGAIKVDSFPSTLVDSSATIAASPTVRENGGATLDKFRSTLIDATSTIATVPTTNETGDAAVDKFRSTLIDASSTLAASPATLGATSPSMATTPTVVV